MSNFWESDLEAGYYDKVLEEGLKKNKGIQANWHNITQLYVRKYIKNDSNHLDYACGPGTLIGKYTQANSMGIDIAKLQIDYAIQKYGEQGTFLTTRQFEFGKYNNYFDVVTILGLIEFLSASEVKELLTKINTILKPGGKLILTTPNFSSLIFPLSDKLGLVNWSGEHKTKLDVKSAVNLLNCTDFKIIQINKILNFGMLVSFINIKFGTFLEKIIQKLTRGSFGFVLIIELEKT